MGRSSRGELVVITVKVPRRLLERVEMVARAQGVGRSEIVRRALETYVKLSGFNEPRVVRL